jgi:hypothetical protein
MTEPDDERSLDEKRHDQLTSAPKSTEADAAPRITTTELDEHTTRIDVADTAAVRPGKAPPS